MKKWLVLLWCVMSIFSLQAQEAVVDYAHKWANESIYAKIQRSNYELAGQWHNEALDEIFKKLSSEGRHFNDPGFIDRFNQLLRIFFESKGLLMHGGLTTSDTTRIGTYFASAICTRNGMSGAANQLLCQLNEAFHKMDAGQVRLQDYLNTCERIQNEAAGLAVTEESATVAITAVVAKYSAKYWDENFYRVLDMFGGNNKGGLWSPQKAYRPGPFFHHDEELMQNKVPWGAIGYADVSGAYQGGRVGAVAGGGLGGAVAGGIMGAAMGSGIRLLMFAFTKS